jgi:hypothetical protein
LTLGDREKGHAGGTPGCSGSRTRDVAGAADSSGVWVSRRVGELVSEWVWGWGSRWSTPRLNDLDPHPQACYTCGADVTGYLLSW